MNSPTNRFGIRACGGSVTLEFADRKLAALDYRNASENELQLNDAARTAFLNWLGEFQRLSPGEQWQCLKPNGTDFQQRVWEQLMQVDIGTTCSYGALASAIGRPKACRAVGSAVGANPICLLIPCHRVIQASGKTGNYRWGADKKLALLDAEQVDSCDLVSLFQ